MFEVFCNEVEVPFNDEMFQLIKAGVVEQWDFNGMMDGIEAAAAKNNAGAKEIVFKYFCKRCYCIKFVSSNVRV